MTIINEFTESFQLYERKLNKIHLELKFNSHGLWMESNQHPKTLTKVSDFSDIDMFIDGFQAGVTEARREIKEASPSPSPRIELASTEPTQPQIKSNVTYLVQIPKDVRVILKTTEQECVWPVTGRYLNELFYARLHHSENGPDSWLCSRSDPTLNDYEIIVLKRSSDTQFINVLHEMIDD